MTWPESYDLYAYRNDEDPSLDVRRPAVPFAELDAAVRQAAVAGYDTILVQIVKAEPDSL